MAFPACVEKSSSAAQADGGQRAKPGHPHGRGVHTEVAHFINLRPSLGS